MPNSFIRGIRRKLNGTWRCIKKIATYDENKRHNSISNIIMSIQLSANQSSARKDLILLQIRNQSTRRRITKPIRKIQKADTRHAKSIHGRIRETLHRIDPISLCWARRSTHLNIIRDLWCLVSRWCCCATPSRTFGPFRPLYAFEFDFGGGN